MGYRQRAELAVARVGAAVFHDFRLPVFGDKSAGRRHFTRIACCILFYSAIALIYIAAFTKIGFWPSLRAILQKPVFYHLWFSMPLR